jgi:hypothetical protein
LADPLEDRRQQGFGVGRRRHGYSIFTSML